MDEKPDFWEAIRRGETEKVISLLEKDPRLLHTVNEAGISPVIVAAHYGHKELAELLADRKVVLHIFEAAVCGRVSTLMYLLARDPKLINACQSDGWHALALACLFHQMEVVKYLLRAGAAVNAPIRNIERWAPLHVALNVRNLEMVRLLLNHDADPNVRAHNGYTPVHLAAQNGDIEILRLLLFYGADIEVKTEDGRTPLDLAQEASQVEAVKLLKSGITKRLRRHFGQSESTFPRI